MSFIRRLLRQEPKVARPTKISQGTQPLEVKGEASYQIQLAAIAGPKTDEGHNCPVVAVLVREPSNVYDPNAIAGYASREDWSVELAKVGYITRGIAVDLAPAIDRRPQRNVGLGGSIVGGWDRGGGDEGHYGIWLKYEPSDFYG